RVRRGAASGPAERHGVPRVAAALARAAGARSAAGGSRSSGARGTDRGAAGSAPRQRVPSDRSRQLARVPAGAGPRAARGARFAQRSLAGLVLRSGGPAVKKTDVVALQVKELESLRKELQRHAGPPRWNADPED